jgi:hypothetical protein
MSSQEFSVSHALCINESHIVLPRTFLLRRIPGVHPVKHGKSRGFKFQGAMHSAMHPSFDCAEAFGPPPHGEGEGVLRFRGNSNVCSKIHN